MKVELCKLKQGNSYIAWASGYTISNTAMWEKNLNYKINNEKEKFGDDQQSWT